MVHIRKLETIVRWIFGTVCTAYVWMFLCCVLFPAVAVVVCYVISSSIAFDDVLRVLLFVFMLIVTVTISPLFWLFVIRRCASILLCWCLRHSLVDCSYTVLMINVRDVCPFATCVCCCCCVFLHLFALFDVIWFIRYSFWYTARVPCTEGINVSYCINAYNDACIQWTSLIH